MKSRIEAVDLLKIDVEKAELDVLAGIEEADWPRFRQSSSSCTCPHPAGAGGRRSLVQHGFNVTIDQDPTMAATGIQMLYAIRPSGALRISLRA